MFLFSLSLVQADTFSSVENPLRLISQWNISDRSNFNELLIRRCVKVLYQWEPPIWSLIIQIVYCYLTLIRWLIWKCTKHLLYRKLFVSVFTCEAHCCLLWLDSGKLSSVISFTHPPFCITPPSAKGSSNVGFSFLTAVVYQWKVCQGYGQIGLATQSLSLSVSFNKSSRRLHFHYSPLC